MKGRAIRYSAKEMAWLEANRLMVISDYASAFAARFGREVSAQNLHALRKRKGWKTGRTGCFPKGNEPFNKGKPHPTRGRAAETQFKRGQLPHNTKWLGHERVSKDGYVEISIAKTNPHTGFNRRYVLKHRHLWELANGPLPKETALKCLDGNKENTDPSNWEAVPRALLPRLAGGNRYHRKLAFDDAAPEIRPSILAIAKLEYGARQRAKREAPRREAGLARKGEHAAPAGGDAPNA
jgi:hypothetical protein